MWDALSFLALPMAACAALVGIHAYFGLHVLKRNVIFVDLALAQVAALGATAAFLLGHAPQSLAAHGYALLATLLAAGLLASSRAWSSRIPQEALIGVLYVVAAAAALLLVDRAPQGAEHIRQILTGNILTVGWDELWPAALLYAGVALVYPPIARRLTPGSWAAEFAFYAAFGLVVTSSVALAGVLLVFAFLIIPAAIGLLHGATFRSQLAIAWVAGAVTAAVGLAVSYAGDFSTGATLVCTYGASLAVAGIVHGLRLPQARGARFVVILRTARWIMAALAAASGIWIMVSPRADQPVLDALESAFPAVRTAYMDEKSRAIADDAGRYAERYRSDAEKLRAQESERRWKGEPMGEEDVRRTASYLKSYNEMLKGETFVVREVRDRAREANRWSIGIVFLVIALSLVVSLPMRSRKIAPEAPRR
ncbi:MAG TPA: metal ABC transporter permease [Usitatibacter sp.]|nr:metal ABC transporter permease [Usitatibacter sp.]